MMTSPSDIPAPGQRWRDCDPRSQKVVTVLEVTERHVWIQRPTVRTRVRRSLFLQRFTLLDPPQPSTPEEHAS